MVQTRSEQAEGVKLRGKGELLDMGGSFWYIGILLVASNSDWPAFQEKLLEVRKR